MNNKTTKIIASAIVFIIYIAYQFFTTGELPNLGGNNSPKSTKNTNAPSKPKSFGSDAAILADLQSKKLIYTKHAKCRMDCRTISKNEVLDVLENGRINHRKSEDQGGECPTVAVEGFTDDNQEVRIIFAQCDRVTKVVTTIDLKRKYNCYCE